VNSKSSEAPQT